LGIRRNLSGLAAGALLVLLAGCSSPSVQEQAMEASQAGDQRKAIELARKDIERFAAADQCSPTVTVNCGTLALAYSTVAQYQILDGDWRAGGEPGQVAANSQDFPQNNPSLTQSRRLSGETFVFVRR
jgi:hypothetical protein